MLMAGTLQATAMDCRSPCDRGTSEIIALRGADLRVGGRRPAAATWRQRAQSRGGGTIWKSPIIKLAQLCDRNQTYRSQFLPVEQATVYAAYCDTGAGDCQPRKRLRMSPATALILCDDAPIAHALVTRLDKEGLDVMFAAHSYEATSRVGQFDISAAVLAWQIGAEKLAAELEDRGVPFFRFGMPKPGTAAISGEPLVVRDLEEVVPTLVTLLSAP